MGLSQEKTVAGGSPGLVKDGKVMELAGRIALVGFVVIALAVFWGGRGEDWYASFAVIFSSIVLEALPFMILGALVSGFVEVFVSQDRLTASTR